MRKLLFVIGLSVVGSCSHETREPPSPTHRHVDLFKVVHNECTGEYALLTGIDSDYVVRKIFIDISKPPEYGWKVSKLYFGGVWAAIHINEIQPFSPTRLEVDATIEYAFKCRDSIDLLNEYYSIKKQVRREDSIDAITRHVADSIDSCKKDFR